MLKQLFLCIGIILFIIHPSNAKDYNGAELYSKKTVKYGRFDVRMRAVSGSGIVSSFFLYYDNSYLGSPEPWQEIDIEVMGKNSEAFQSNLITGTAESKKTSEKMHSFDKLSENYHTYSFEWTPDYIAWFFDGKEVRRSTDAQVQACSQKEMSYRFNLWISDVTSWAGQFNPSILPVYQYINWMKYSTYTPGSGENGTNFTFEWQEDFDSFNSSRWAKGDWTFDGNIVDFTPNNIVVKDGYCIICLTTTGATGFSGTVPKDLETPILRVQPEPSFRIQNGAHLQQTPSFSVSLDGRLIMQKSIFSTGYTGLLITPGNNTVLQRVNLSK